MLAPLLGHHPHRPITHLGRKLRRLPHGSILSKIGASWKAGAVHQDIPERIRQDIRDAQKCISHGIWSAAAVLCGKAVERLAAEKAPGKTLAVGLTKLKADGVIDEKLFLWADALRRERNLGAHAGEEEVTKENATDVLAFTVAIFEYIYTLSTKYEEFMARKNSKE